MLDDIWKDNRTDTSGEDVSDNVALIKATVDKLRQNEKDNENDPWVKLVLLMADYEEGNEELITFKNLLSHVNNVNEKARTGVSLIHYTIVYNHASYIELLHDQSNRGKLDLNQFDSVVGYSPLMWCFELNRQDCCIELFSFIDELRFDITNKDGLKAWDVVAPGSAISEFLDQNNISQYMTPTASDTFSQEAYTIKDDHNEQPSNFDINLQIAGMSLENDSTMVTNNTNNFGEFVEEFDFDKLIKYQYLEFSDYDVPEILDLLISLPRKHAHMTTYPAALIFQCVRYAAVKVDSPPLVESLIHLSLTRILATVSSDLIPNVDATGDIVIQSYWLSALSFLYYYLCRIESFFKKYPNILQDLINALHSLMIELTSSIHSRLVPLMDPALLSYTTIEDVKQTLYKRDWNFFKKRKQLKQTVVEERKRKATPFYDHEMLKHLYPPSLQEQMKLSPMKIVQIFGALSYVLDLHHIHPLFQQQCLSISINWFSTTLFNKIIKDKKKKCLSRAHAIQIRLNLSSLETWIKNNDLVVPKPVLVDSFMWERFPFTLVRDLADINLSQPPLRNVATYRPTGRSLPSSDPVIIRDITNSLFYYQPFHRITQIHLEPVLQLLQWLQVATTLTNDESLEATMKLLPRLTPFQLLKSIDKYNYEVEEHKFSSTLKKKLSNIVKNKESKDSPYLPERQLPLLVLPTVTELTDTYTRRMDNCSFQPLLPMDIQDEVYELHEENTKLRRNAVNEPKKDGEEEVESQSNYSGNSRENDSMKNDDIETADDYFKELKAPLATVQRRTLTANDEIETNPW